MDKIKEASMEVSVYILSAEAIKKLNSIFAVMIMIRRAMLYGNGNAKFEYCVMHKGYGEPTEKVPQMNKFTNTTRIIRI